MSKYAAPAAAQRALALDPERAYDARGLKAAGIYSSILQRCLAHRYLVPITSERPRLYKVGPGLRESVAVQPLGMET